MEDRKNIIKGWHELNFGDFLKLKGKSKIELLELAMGESLQDATVSQVFNYMQHKDLEWILKPIPILKEGDKEVFYVHIKGVKYIPDDELRLGQYADYSILSTSEEARLELTKEKPDMDKVRRLNDEKFHLNLDKIICLMLKPYKVSYVEFKAKNGLYNFFLENIKSCNCVEVNSILNFFIYLQVISGKNMQVN